MKNLDSKKIVSGFAVGCFHYVFRNETDELEDFETYLTAIKEGLEKIDNVSNVAIENVTSTSSTIVDPDWEEDYVNGPFNPLLSSGSIYFEVYIPNRVQEDVFPYRRKTGCERFSVTTFYDYRFPISIIASLEPGGYSDRSGFSGFVPIVREYMSSRWDRTHTVQFATLGPSPFHADFYVTSESAEAYGLHVNHREGYDDIVLNTDPLLGEGHVKAMMEEILSILPWSYYSVYARNAFSTRRDGVMDQVHSLLTRMTETNHIKNLVNYFVKSNKRDIANIYLQVFDLDSTASLFDRIVREYKSNRTEYQSSELWYYVNSSLDRWPSDVKSEIEPLMRLTEMFETGGSNNRTVFIAALLSAILTVSATFGVAAWQASLKDRIVEQRVPPTQTSESKIAGTPPPT